MIAVLDASAAVEVVLQRKLSGKLTESIIQADSVLAPHLFISEVTNVLWKYYSFADLSFRDCEKRLKQAIKLPDRLIDEKEIFLEAFKLGCSLKHSIYDLLYLIIARRNNGILLTTDNKLTEIANKLSIDTLS